MTATQHRALVRLEDLHPLSDPTAVLQAAEWLFGNGIPFGFHVTARYLDPTAITPAESRRMFRYTHSPL